MKKLITSIICLCSFHCVSNAAVTLNSTSLINAPGLSIDDIGVYIVSEDFSSFDFVTLEQGLSLTDNSTYGSSFTVVGSNTASSGFGSIAMGSGHSFSLEDGIDTGDPFAIVVFEQSTSTTILGDTFKVWTEPATWLIPEDGETAFFGATFNRLSNPPNFTGIVVPEPSAYALLLGMLAMGVYIILRRFRNTALTSHTAGNHSLKIGRH